MITETNKLTIALPIGTKPYKLVIRKEPSTSWQKAVWEAVTCSRLKDSEVTSQSTTVCVGGSTT